jgi:cysteine synthase
VVVVGIEPQPGHRIPGLKSFREAKQPSILDWSVIDEVVRVDDVPAYEMTRRLFLEEGLMVGPSTGAVVHAVAEFATEGVAVGVSADSGLKYTSYFAELLGDQGLPGI